MSQRSQFPNWPQIPDLFRLARVLLAMEESNKQIVELAQHRLSGLDTNTQLCSLKHQSWFWSVPAGGAAEQLATETSEAFHLRRVQECLAAS